MSAPKTITVEGGCHCGAVRYSCKPKPDAETGRLDATRCNCTFCQKLGSFTGVHLDTDAADSFTLISPESREGLGDYLHGQTTVHRYFCKTCGVHIWREGSYPFEGKMVALLSVNLCTINQPQDVVDLKDVKIRYFDGLHNNWTGGLKDEPWSGGIV